MRLLIVDYRSQIVVIKNLEGERDAGQQPLATCTFLRSHLRRGVVHLVLVRVKVQRAKSFWLLCKPTKGG